MRRIQWRQTSTWQWWRARMWPRVAVGVLLLAGVGIGASGSTWATSDTRANTSPINLTTAYSGGRLMAADPTGGYWTVSWLGAISSYGGAPSYGSPAQSQVHLNKPIVGMAATPDGGGYWLVASDGGVFSYGDAGFYGSTGAIHLNQPIVGMAATPDGQGYWLVASDGGVFSYGDAGFYGSTGGSGKSVDGIIVDPEHTGYTLVNTSGADVIFSSLAASGTTASPSQSGLAAELGGLKLINYYPSTNSWTRMWSNFDAVDINSALTTMHQMGANVVRLIIPPSTFGYPVPAPNMEAELSQTIAMAKNDGLSVELTLFDLFGSYSDISGSEAWASSILAPYKNDPTISFVEIQNEINPTNSAAISWLQNIIPAIRNDVGSIPITASVTNTTNSQTGASMDVSQSLALLIPELQNTPLDFYDVHYYGSAGLAYTILNNVRQEAGSTPVYVGETGYSSWDGSTSTNAETEAQQNLYLCSVELAVQKLGLGFAGVWDFQDFVAGQGGPNDAPGTYSAENFFGLIRQDGSWKPAANSIASLFQTGQVNTNYNGNFAAGSGDAPLDWSTQYSAFGELSWNQTSGYQQGSSVSISDSTSAPNDGPPNFEVSPVDNLGAPGETVSASVFAQTVGGTGLNALSIAWYGSSSNFLGSVYSSSIDGTTAWTTLSIVAPAPANAAYFVICLNSQNNNGTVTFDDVNSSVS